MPFVATACATATRDASAEARAPRPHIVIFLADDLGWKDVGYHGGEIATPHIDALARGGTRLEAFYIQPVCSPTRAALMTGRYPMRMGLQVGVIRPHAKYGLALDEVLLPQALQRAGYKTAICGKWHLGTLTPEYLPTRRGFDQQYGHYLGAIDYFSKKRNGAVDWNRGDRPLDEEGYTTDLIGAEAARVVAAHDPQEPLFLYVPFNAPHTPLQAPQRALDKHRHIGRKQRRAFAAMVTCMDDAIGRVMAALDARGMRDDTLVIFASDNGGGRAADTRPWRGRKGSVFEGGTRSPTVVHWPGRVPAGASVDEVLHIVDLFPTLARVAGASTEGSKALDGLDAWETITSGAASPHEDILLNVTKTLGAVRMGDWKLVHHTPRANRPRAPKGYQLFNLAEDPRERRDYAKQQPEVLAEMKRRLLAYRAAAAPSLGGAGPMPKGPTPQRWGHPDR